MKMIREIRISDLNDRYFNLLAQLSGDVKDVDREDLWKYYFSNPCHKIFVYIEQGEIVGTAGIFIEHKLLHCGSHVGHIEDVVVDDNCRGKGVGEALIARCKEYAGRWECYKVILDCSQDNVSFYEKCGFRTVSVGMRCE